MYIYILVNVNIKMSMKTNITFFQLLIVTFMGSVKSNMLIIEFFCKNINEQYLNRYRLKIISFSSLQVLMDSNFCGAKQNYMLIISGGGAVIRSQLSVVLSGAAIDLTKKLLLFAETVPSSDPILHLYVQPTQIFHTACVAFHYYLYTQKVSCIHSAKVLYFICTIVM